MKAQNYSPWFWIPTLYFAEGIPYFIVNQISIIMFTNMGVSKEAMAFFTSILYLPWVIKPFWSPFVDILKTKRWWIIAMQIVMAISFLLLALFIPNIGKLNSSAHTSTPFNLFTITLILFIVTAFASATYDIAADGFYMLSLNKEQQSFFVGIRSTFYRLSSWFGQGILVYIAGVLEVYCNNIPLAWKIVFIGISLMFLLLSLYHIFFLAKPITDINTNTIAGKGITIKRGVKQILVEFIHAFITFFQKEGVVVAILFMLLFRLPEALMLKLVYPFFIDPIASGGLGLSIKEYSLIYGTIGVICLTIGGILGGVVAAKYGFKKVLWPMVFAITLPCCVFVYMAVIQPSSLLLISFCIGIEQFGYGFGFQAYMLYMMFFSDGEYKTSHYAICTGFMALGMMLPGLLSGWLCDVLGYTMFFGIGMLLCISTFVVAKLIRVNKFIN